MDWLTVASLTIGLLLLGFIALRVERLAFGVIVGAIVLPVVVAIGAWATLFRHWGETLIALGAATAIAGTWWALGGRLPRARGDTIKVWGQEPGPRPKPPDTTELQSEVRRLQDEAARLEAELRRLKGSNGKDEGSQTQGR